MPVPARERAEGKEHAMRPFEDPDGNSTDGISGVRTIIAFCNYVRHTAFEEIIMRHDYPQAGTPVWIDLNNPTTEEIEAVSAACGLRILSRPSLSEIETSSRILAD